MSCSNNSSPLHIFKTFFSFGSFFFSAYKCACHSLSSKTVSNLSLTKLFFFLTPPSRYPPSVAFVLTQSHQTPLSVTIVKLADLLEEFWGSTAGIHTCCLLAALPATSFRQASFRTRLGWFTSCLSQTESAAAFPCLTLDGLPSCWSFSLPVSLSRCYSSLKSHLMSCPPSPLSVYWYPLKSFWCSFFLSFLWQLP